MVDFDNAQCGVTKALVGRGGEFALIGAFLDRAAAGGEALLLCGEPGAGKTALLDATAAAASEAGVRVLRAAGVEFEADMAFSVLHQVLIPLQEEFSQLSDTHRAALNVALGFGEGPAPDRLVVSNAALTVLRAAAATCPVLVVVDDVAWLDRASAGVLGFVARRLVGSQVGFLAASRSEEESFFERVGLPRHELGPLDEEAASGLVSSRFPALVPRVRQQVLAEARGNPLALLELSAAFDGHQPAVLAQLPAVLPVSRRLLGMFSSRVTGLPARTRQLLLLAALDGTGDSRVVDVARAGQQGLDDLAVAEQARLIYVDQRTRRLAFGHPLIRTAVAELSTHDERRRAHAELAELWVEHPERRAWHLAEAAIGPDEHVAGLLEQAALRVMRRGDAVGAVQALIRSSELSPIGADRSRRLAVAAYIGADVTGELRSAPRLLADARMADPDSAGSLQAAVAAAYLLLNGDGDVDTAHRLLVGAIRAKGDDASDTVLEEALATLLQVCVFGGRGELWEPCSDALARLTPDAHGPLHLMYKTLADPARTAAAALDQIDAAIERLAGDADPARIVRTAVAAVFVDRLAGCREALWRVVHDAREGGAVTSGITALIVLSLDSFFTGQWDLARQLADEAVGLCEIRGYLMLQWSGRHVQALLAAARGDFDTTQALSDQLIQWAAPRGARVVQWCAWRVQTLAALGRGDFEEAYRQATAISPAGALASHVSFALYVPMDLVEAAVRTGRHAEADAHVAAIQAENIAALSPRFALLACGSAAIAAPEDSAAGLFEEALAIPGADAWPFDLARVQLAYGERLRRAQATSESRRHLVAALGTFERLGATPWAGRAASELRATGQTRYRAGERDHVSLTPQEREIATLAASGLSNKEIGHRLFLSPRTVSGHLHRIFPKLDITSRAALRDALNALSPEEEGDTRS
ncbi:MAG: hypothetical protein QOH09_1778 [Pseudonocardiales bacterium]|nr:hypothetical protein [Pseudonocardiales bacterium]